MDFRRGATKTVFSMENCYLHLKKDLDPKHIQKIVKNLQQGLSKGPIEGFFPDVSGFFGPRSIFYIDVTFFDG